MSDRERWEQAASELRKARELRAERDHYRRALIDRLTRALNNWSDACGEAEEAGLPERTNKRITAKAIATTISATEEALVNHSNGDGNIKQS